MVPQTRSDICIALRTFSIREILENARTHEMNIKRVVARVIGQF